MLIDTQQITKSTSQKLYQYNILFSSSRCFLLHHLSIKCQIFIISSWLSFFIFFYPLKSISEEIFQRVMELEWEKIPETNGYEIEIIRIDKDEKKPMYFKQKDAKWRAKLKFGQYQMKLRSFDRRNVPGPWSDPTIFWVKALPPKLLYPKHQSKIKSTEEAQQNFTFRWSPSIGAAKYKIEVKNKEGHLLASEITTQTSISIPLPVAQSYEWKVTSLMSENQEGEVSNSLFEFSVIGKKINAPELEIPNNGFVRLIEWSEPSFARSYSIALQKKENNQWKTIVKESHQSLKSFTFANNLPGGQYRFKIRAEAPLRISSDIVSEEFRVNNDRSPVAEEQALLKTVIDSQKHYYFFASYLITQISYEGVFREQTDIPINLKALGGTGRLGIFYYPNKSGLGYFGLIDLSGFLFQGKNVTFFATEFHAVWKKFFWGANQFRMTGGLFVKELPEVRYFSQTDSFSLSKLASTGPHFGVEYWRPLSKKIGFQVNSSLYYSMAKISTPNSKNLNNSLSYQIGLMGTMKLSDEISGLLGYTYRMDHASYLATTQAESPSTSVASQGSSNNMSVSGHYLTLRLEWGF